MKKAIVILLILIPVLQYAQELKPDSKNALVHFSIKDVNGGIIQSEILFYSYKTNTKTSVKPNNLGKGQILLPIDATYSAYILTSDSKYDFQIPNYPNLQFEQNFVFDNSNPLELHPSPTHAVVNLLITNGTIGPIQEQFTIRSSSGDFSQSVESNKNGKAQILLPINKTYFVSFQQAKDYGTFTIPNTPFYILDKKIYYEGINSGSLFPTTSMALLNLNYIDFDKKPNVGELIKATSKKTGKSYEGTTNSEGKAQILLPIGNDYVISTKYFKDFTIISIPNKAEKTISNFIYSNISSKQFEIQEKEYAERTKKFEEAWKNREKELDSLKKIQEEEFNNFIKVEEFKRIRKNFIEDSIARADSLENIRIEKEIARIKKLEAAEDSIKLIGLLQEKAKFDSIKNIQNAKEKNRNDSIQKIIDLKTTQKLVWNANYETDNEIWGDENNVVFTVMKRNNWKKQLVVVDVTGSMTPYAQLIKNWFILNFSENDTTHFVFFNDGDNTPDVNKVIGKTGGIYICENCNIIEAENNYKIASRWKGEDIPENDMEALLAAVDSIKNFSDLILIADNNSKVRDFRLLSQLNVPVHVVLCGVIDDIINEQYLTIANKTKGSVSTIEQDIEFKKKLVDGDEVSIGLRKYKLINNNFVRVK